MGLTRPGPASARRGRRAPVVLCLAALAAGPGPAGSALAEPGTTRIALLALNGFDPVSYFLADGPRAGTARFELSWGGRVWRFANGANREAFRDDPAVYAPRLGGYDGTGVLEGRLVDADPLVFAVIGERLYLFRDAARRARFTTDPALAGQAEAAWPDLGDLLDAPPRPAR